jgi:hypothetical protein
LLFVQLRTAHGVVLLPNSAVLSSAISPGATAGPLVQPVTPEHPQAQPEPDAEPPGPAAR